MENTNIHLRELTEANELERFMKLRYKSYLGGPLHHFLKINSYELDIDLYDLHAKHYGLFHGKTPIGYIRIILDRTGTFNESILAIGKKFGFYGPSIESIDSIQNLDYPPYPFLSYLSIPETVERFFADCKRHNHKLLEGSRLMLFGAHRGLRLARFLLECSISLAIGALQKDYAVVNCDAGHEKFYQKYGFQTISHSQREYGKGPKRKKSMVISLILPLKLHKIGTPYQDKVGDMITEFSNNKQITFQA